jgi:hypothetical protein
MVDAAEEAAKAALKKKIADCDRKLRQYRAALDSGADPVEVSDGSTRPSRCGHGPKATCDVTQPRGMSEDHDAANVLSC